LLASHCPRFSPGVFSLCVCVWLQPSKSQKVPYKILKGMNHLAKFREKVTREKVRAACCTQKGHVEYD